jgi:AcrR family transcriptional regulator
MTRASATSGRHRDGPATRARIEKEALHLFAAKGVDGTTIRDISLAVGVADAALYRYFASKEEIASAIFNRHYGALAQEIRLVRQRGLTLHETVAALVSLLCRLFDEEPDIFVFILLNQHAHLRYVQPQDNAVEEIRAIMQRAGENGELRVSDPDLAAAMALGAVLQPAIFKLYGRLPGPLAAHADDLTSAALGAVGAVHPTTTLEREDLAL